jgi:RNA polymerase sigma factor (sigma-70 family)
VARGYRLSSADVDEVVQTAWLRAIEHVGELDDPGAIDGWLVMIARRLAMRTLQRGVREVVTDALPEPAETGDRDPEAIALRREAACLLHGAIDHLPDRQRRVIKALLASPAASYQQLAANLDMPVGAIGPTRGRALGALRCDARLLGLR